MKFCIDSGKTGALHLFLTGTPGASARTFVPMIEGDRASPQEQAMARDVNVGPAAEKKLERYGVWVKVEPRDVTRDLGGSSGLTDLEPEAAGEPAGRGSFTDEEEHLLDELETGVGHEVAAGTQVELESLDEQLPELED